ncbi:MAG: phosphatase PAP2 family protein [Oscillospiraceae bacterium]|nr:phosphatase PAP2 family protein [Oscillospiraceae bacterium]
MTEEKYRHMLAFFRKTLRCEQIMHFLCSFSPLPVIAAYLCGIGGLIASRSVLVIRFVAVPAITLISVTVLRKLVNAPRPYEVYAITPLIDKTNQGQSMPSRHTASAVIIGIAFLYISPPVGIFFLLWAVWVGISRILAGAHFIKDVLVGAALALVMGVVGFYIL